MSNRKFRDLPLYTGDTTGTNLTNPTRPAIPSVIATLTQIA